MKIVYIIHQFFPEYYTGTEKFIYNISSMMQKAGHGVRVLTYGFYQDSFFDKRIGNILYREFVYKGVPVTALRHKKIPGDISFIMGDRDMRPVAEELLEAEKPDVVHVGHAMRMSEFIAVTRAMDVPYLMTLTDFWMICPKVNLLNAGGDICSGPEGCSACRKSCPELPKALLSQRYENARDILFHAGQLIAPSGFLKGLFKKEFSSLNTSVLNHGINRSKTKKNKKHYRKGDSLVFCYAGSLNDHKGVHVLIEAFKMTKSERLTLRIFGSGPNPLYVEKLTEMAREDKRIEFCGVYSEEAVGDIFSSIDVVVVPSLWYETYSLVLHEAFVCNTPAIVSDIGALAEKIRDGVNGFSFQMGDAEALESVIVKIVADPGILNTLKENMKHLSIPTVEQEAFAYYRVYRSLEQ